MRNTTNALWGVSGALLVGSVVLAIFTKWKSSEEKASKENSSQTPRIELGVGQGGASVSVTGRF